MCSVDICPFNLKITPVGSSLRISWSISDKVPTIDILGYNIYHTYNGKWKQIYVKEDRHYSFNKLKPSKTYRFKVSACLRNRVESKCTQEETFNTELPIQPKVGIPNGENSKIVLTWNSPRNTLIKIEGYEIQWSIDNWHTIADKKIVAFNVFRHEIETAKEGVIYWIKICSCSNSVKSLYEVFQPFTTRHDMFTMEVTYDTYDQKDKDLVQNNVDEIFKNTCNGFPGDQKIIHKSESEGSIVVTIMFISEEFNDEKVLHDTLKNAFQKEMIGSHTIKFKHFWLKKLNDPSPPQLVKASRVHNGVLVSWKEPLSTFFKTKEYVVEYTEEHWISPESIVVPVDKNSCFITKVLPSAKIQVKVYTCICHSIRSSPSHAVSTVVKG
ncbi:uncharacterized protein LOC127736860 [Mytilus californianus]|uniref:uncharacterized protein LOC127736860 n=1 Tax=Mytilus californianus TaxID=6549 RepID=UPI0022451D81|nr:uncharacterized protein LOC127736860 [Mytilus californianus]